MAMVLDESTSLCNHCDRAIPLSNFDLHCVHCSRNLEKCKFCGDMVPKKHAEEHYLSTHAPVACSLCSQTVERETLDVHTGVNCPRRIVTCEYCEFPLPAIDLFEHQEVCGNRTEFCNACRKYIRLRDQIVHETTCAGVPDDVSQPSRVARPQEREQERAPPRRPRGAIERRHLLFTIAIAGIAVMLGSFFVQRKVGSGGLL